jgi:hypothetical protein
MVHACLHACVTPYPDAYLQETTLNTLEPELSRGDDSR